MKEVVIVSACRTAIGAFGGTLRDSHAAYIAAAAMKEAVKRAGIDPAIIDDVLGVLVLSALVVAESGGSLLAPLLKLAVFSAIAFGFSRWVMPMIAEH
ncbi:MAG: hypothetical protein HZB24_03415, partial [Desulfobacterales bacterium]|nr:hypothetical protein [Desulfobacterales bacterium]